VDEGASYRWRVPTAVLEWYGIFREEEVSYPTNVAIVILRCVEVKNGDDDLRRLRDEVLQLVRASAEAEGRVVGPANWFCLGRHC
jgi:hypothetical protein